MQTKTYKRNYSGHWAVLGALGGLVLVFLHWKPIHAPLPALVPAQAAPLAPTDWYYTIKIPEITTQHESGVDTMKARLTDWLQTLQAEGFHPMLLSDVLKNLREGRGLPERTVVTVFSPGYRRTHDIVAPILSQLHWPAVWLTDEQAMKRSDRRLVTYHTSRQMLSSGLWDVAFDKGNGQFRLDSPSGQSVYAGDDDHHAWSTLAGAFALNHGAIPRSMNFLTVNSAWLASELLNRLLVETPPMGNPVFLSKGIIQGREWGITLPEGRVDLNPVFDLKAPLNRRGNKLFFLGTRGVDNYQLHVQCDRLVGEFWTQLRVDDVAGEAINVIYTDRSLFVVRHIHESKTRIFFGAHATPQNGKGFVEDLTLSGDSLTISFNGGAPVTLKGLHQSAPGQGLMEIYVADKPHGTARADNISIEFKPL